MGPGMSINCSTLLSGLVLYQNMSWVILSWHWTCNTVNLVQWQDYRMLNERLRYSILYIVYGVCIHVQVSHNFKICLQAMFSVTGMLYPDVEILLIYW